MSFSPGQTKLSVISGCPYQAGVRRAGFHCRREIKTRVYGKRQMSDSRLRFLKINNRYTEIVQNNFHVYG